MSIPIHELEAEILNLGPTDRARLLERLIESFEPDSKIQDVWITEALRRESAVLSGKTNLAAGAEAVARARARIS